MPKRKRKRTRLKPTPFLTIALVVALATGFTTSSLTSVSKVYVSGARDEDRPEVQRILAQLNNQPWVHVNARRIETEVQRIQAVDHAEYSQNLLGRGHLKVVYRSSVARVRGPVPMAMDRQGVIYRTAEVSADLPEIILPAPPPTTLTIAGSSPVGRLAQLALKIKQIEPKESLKISYNRDGALCLRIRNGLVILGSTDDFENKLRILQDFREQNPGVLDGLQSFDLTAPSAPVKTYKKER